MKPEDIAPKVKQIVYETAQYVRTERQKWHKSDVRSKDDTSLVTSLDLASEERLIAGFRALLPSSSFMAEEKFNDRSYAEYVWIIDPIDGTTNLVHGLPVYCISVALQKEGKTILGIIYEITSGECFFACDGIGGATLNDLPIKVSTAPTLQKSLLATGFPTVDLTRLDYYLDILKNFITDTRGIRRLGSAAMDLAYVACGRCDGFYEYGLNAWDIAAGAYLVEKAGGKVNDFKGGEDFLFGREIVASNGLIQNEFLKYF